jgi:hypothetical protein
MILQKQLVFFFFKKKVKQLNSTVGRTTFSKHVVSYVIVASAHH